MSGVRKPKQRIRLFQPGGEPFQDDMMYVAGADEAIQEGFRPAIEAGLHEGHQLRCLFRSSGPDGVSLCRAWLKSNFRTPRHSHDTDCTYYILTGSLKFGNTKLGPGSGMFVPAHSIYSLQAGPEGVEVLEFRGASCFNVEYLGNSKADWDIFCNTVVENVDTWSSQEVPPSLSENVG